jgi:hypothetical protein
MMSFYDIILQLKLLKGHDIGEAIEGDRRIRNACTTCV